MSRGSISRPSLRALTEALEEPAGDELHVAPLRRIGAAREPHLHLGRGGRGKELRTALHLALGLFDQRPRVARDDLAGAMLFGGIELLRIRDREIPEHDRVEHREHGRRATNAQREREHRDGGDERVP